MSSTTSPQAGPCCCCGFKRDHGIVVCNRSLTEMSVLLNDTPPINWSSASVSHLFLMAEARESRLWTGVQSRCFSFPSLLFSYIYYFSFFTVCVSDPISVHPSRSLWHTHTHTHTPTHTLTLSRSLLLFSYKRNSVSLWHLSGRECALNFSPFNALYEKVFNWVKLTSWFFFFFFCTKKRGIIFLYCKFSSVFWDAFIWLKLLMNFLQVQCHWINIQWLSLLKVCQLLRGCF